MGRYALCVNYLRHCNRHKWASHVTQLNPNHHVESPGVTLLPWKLLHLHQWKTTLFLNFLAFHIHRPFSFGSSGQTRPRSRPRGWSWLPSEKQRHIGSAHTRAQAYLPYWIWGRIFILIHDSCFAEKINKILSFLKRLMMNSSDSFTNLETTVLFLRSEFVYLFSCLFLSHCLYRFLDGQKKGRF